jgi:hypothetical protein
VNFGPDHQFEQVRVQFWFINSLNLELDLALFFFLQSSAELIQDAKLQQLSCQLGRRREGISLPASSLSSHKCKVLDISPWPTSLNPLAVHAGNVVDMVAVGGIHWSIWKNKWQDCGAYVSP